MLNFRNANIAVLVGMTILLVLDRVAGVPLYLYFALIIVYLASLVYGSSYVKSGFYFKVICSADTDKKVIAISFDDGPVPGNTSEILRILREQQAEAAFFCIGSRVIQNEELCRRLRNEGHIIGNHSHSHHFWFDLFSPSRMLADLKQMDQSLRHATGLSPRFFRPPYGVTNPNLKKAVAAGSYVPIGWNIRSMDTVASDDRVMLERISKALRPGAIVLFHDTSGRTVSILPEFIKRARSQGFEIVRLDKMLNLDPYV
jgi:peptidoglycan/xylan/chitin deacetylase (PgdA/CDA1 family)